MIKLFDVGRVLCQVEYKYSNHGDIWSDILLTF